MRVEAVVDGCRPERAVPAGPRRCHRDDRRTRARRRPGRSARSGGRRDTRPQAGRARRRLPRRDRVASVGMRSASKSCPPCAATYSKYVPNSPDSRPVNPNTALLASRSAHVTGTTSTRSRRTHITRTSMLRGTQSRSPANVHSSTARFASPVVDRGVERLQPSSLRGRVLRVGRHQVDASAARRAGPPPRGSRSGGPRARRPRWPRAASSTSRRTSGRRPVPRAAPS